MADAAKRYAIVTGSNKGIRFETARQLASKGIKVLLTARDEKKGLEALHALKEFDDLSNDDVIFHKLDVADPASVASMVDFDKTHFEKLDIQVNNAAILGAKVDFDVISSFIKAPNADVQEQATVPVNDLSEIMSQTYESAEECVQINYYRAKRVVELLLPPFQLSDSPRVVNVTTSVAKLENINNEWAKGILIDDKRLTEERVDEVLHEFLKDMKEGSLETKGWPPHSSAYIVSKVALNSYTRLLAKRYPNFRINSVCPALSKPI
ncbi:(+)-neomenthol dehydrogenase-like isoform X1 [Juglans microcarpa x Juglans regia]|uniref:(+)-neomenthol dehydrogenase-like isoform X1 n=1 Tax=Juglans microcarpa x Juglans regia TaxID=2249226 RepID=UPI001B7DF0CF|nr:(+)-neomenthol dehydrogenase-like isoform X1 [Juglans microcarpa x Juglans regia]